MIKFLFISFWWGASPRQKSQKGELRFFIWTVGWWEEKLFTIKEFSLIFTFSILYIRKNCRWLWTRFSSDDLNCSWPEKRDKRCVFIHHCWACGKKKKKKKSTSDGFPLKTEGWTKTSLKTIPFPPKAIKTCTQLYKEFPDLKAK